MPAPVPQAYKSTNSILALGDPASSPEAFDQISQVGDISDVGFAATLHDTSSHSTTDGWASQITGLKKQKEVDFTLWFKPTNPQMAFDVEGSLTDMALQNTLGHFLYYPHGFKEKAKTFYAYVSEVGEPVPVDGVLTLKVKLAPTGALVVGVDATGLVTLDDGTLNS